MFYKTAINYARKKDVKELLSSYSIDNENKEEKVESCV